MTRQRHRTRSRTTRGGSLLRRVFIAAVVIAMASLVVQSGALDSVQGSRVSSINAAEDSNALVGIGMPDSVPTDAGGAPVSCTFGSDALVLTHGHSSDVDTEDDVIVNGWVPASITTDGCVRINSGARVDEDIDAGGSVTLKSGSTVYANVEAGGDVTVGSGSRIDGDVLAGGDIDVLSGGRVDEDVESGGDVTVGSGARVGGDVTAAGSVTVHNGGQVGGNVEEGVSGAGGGGGTSTGDLPRLVTVTNNQNDDVAVTVTLPDSDDGTLHLGSDTGTSVTTTLSPGEQQDVLIDASTSGGSDVDFRVFVENIEDGSEVTLERSVAKSSDDDGGNGDDGDDGDQGDDNDDGNGGDDNDDDGQGDDGGGDDNDDENNGDDNDDGGGWW